MISRKVANRIEITEFVLFVLLHVIYSVIMLEKKEAVTVAIYAMITTGIATLCLYKLKDDFWSQIGFVMCAIVATFSIGTQTKTLAFGICVYMVTGALIAIIGERKLNLWFVILTNLSLLLEIVFRREMISYYMPMEMFVLLILFFEAFLVTENYMVMLYQQKVEEVEIQNELLNVAKRSKDDFLANMSHEIRTPMNAIVGMSELIMREENISETVREQCYNIQNSGEHLLHIVNDILDFSKIESGKMEIQYEPYNIAAILQDVANTAMFRRGYKNLDIIIDCSPNMPTQLIGDEIRNRQILLNLINNAIKFTEEGYVYVKIDCYEKENQNWIRMKIEDTGCGIKEEEQAELFESFIRLDTKKNRSIEGTGLGLAICKRLIEMMNGKIHLTSQYGKGTTVVVELPQEIADKVPYLSIKEPEHLKVVLYGDNEVYPTRGGKRYKETYCHLWEDLQVSHRLVLDFATLMKMVEKDEVTHLFLGYEDYYDQQAYYDRIATAIKIFVLYDPQYEVVLGENINGVYLPFYAISIISAVNGESFVNQYIDKKQLEITYRITGIKALVVDDNEVNLRVAEGILRLFEIQPILAHSGKEAIERLKKKDIDIVFMDHMMPEMDGIETTTIVRRTGGAYGKDLPIIAMTANVANDAKDMFLQSGFQDFLPKPVSLKDVDCLLRKWIPKEKIEKIDKTKPAFVPMKIHKESALENMGGMKDLYKELLEYSIEMKEQRLEEINKSFRLNNMEEYQIQVHALKGAMKSLGVEELAQAALVQELACKEGRYEDAIEGHAHFLKEYERGHESISLFLKNETW